MKCPYCQLNQTNVLESRSVDQGDQIRRRRDCSSCGKRFTTYERVEKLELWVVKRDGRRELFLREKLWTGVSKAFHKRSVARDKIENLVSEIEQELLSQDELEVSSVKLGDLVLERIRTLDKVAWLRFASVYLAPEDLPAFEKLLKSEFKVRSKN